MWTFEYEDGSKEEFYACEGSAQREIDDSRVHKTDKELDDFLDKMWDKTNPYLKDEYGAVDVTYDSKLKMVNIKQQSSGE
jgi:hypothetical protein